jgi:hypothetical protein
MQMTRVYWPFETEHKCNLTYFYVLEFLPQRLSPRYLGAITQVFMEVGSSKSQRGTVMVRSMHLTRNLTMKEYLLSLG